MLSILILAHLANTTITLVPTESVWVYANASSPGDGSLLRAWGVDGKSCPPEGEDAGQFSFSYLKWDVSKLPAGAKLTSARLYLNNTPDPGFSLEEAKKSPLEVRPLIGDFNAKGWTFDMSAKIRPNGGEKSTFGTGFPTSISDGVPVPITINLLAGPNDFSKALAGAVGSTGKVLELSLTAALDPSAGGRSAIYRVYGEKEPKESLRPQLVLIYQ